MEACEWGKESELHPFVPCRRRRSYRNWRSSPFSASWPRSTSRSLQWRRGRNLRQSSAWSRPSTNPASWAWRALWRPQNSEVEMLTSCCKGIKTAFIKSQVLYVLMYCIHFDWQVTTFVQLIIEKSLNERKEALYKSIPRYHQFISLFVGGTLKARLIA